MGQQMGCFRTQSLRKRCVNEKFVVPLHRQKEKRIFELFPVNGKAA
jgi:hypothetical protein